MKNTDLQKMKNWLTKNGIEFSTELEPVFNGTFILVKDMRLSYSKRSEAESLNVLEKSWGFFSCKTHNAMLVRLKKQIGA